MQQITHDNHFVPQLYLKQWSDDGVNLWAYRILVSHENVPEWERRPIRGVAYQHDLYTSLENGDEVDNFERWLEEDFEKPVLGSIKKVLHDNTLTTQDWEHLAKYLGAQDVRTPLSYLESMERWSKTFPKVMQDTIEKSINEFDHLRGRGELPDHLDIDDNQFFKNSINVKIYDPKESETEQGYIEAKVNTGRAMWLESQKLLLTKTINVLLNHKWSIVRPAKGFQWFTCDHPVVRLNYYADGKYDLKGGWGNKGANLFMPISPHHLLFTQIGFENPDRFTMTTEQTRKIQGFIAERALRWIFADREMRLIRKLRPRLVDPDAYNRENEQWKNWHDQQSQAENGFA